MTERRDPDIPLPRNRPRRLSTGPLLFGATRLAWRPSMMGVCESRLAPRAWASYDEDGQGISMQGVGWRGGLLHP
jgi:hypothetical protein